jgi:ribosomal protein S18 acetylase RimI-like enzyme
MDEKALTLDRDAPTGPPAEPVLRTENTGDLPTETPDASAEDAQPALRPATAGDVPRLEAVLADAFFDDPIFGWLMPDAAKRRARLRRYFGIELRHLVLPRGRVWTTGDLAGAMLSLPPRRWRSPLRVTLLEGTAFGVHLFRAARIGAAMELRHLHGPHYYVRDIGVHPDQQGRGLGSTLMGPTLERCDREGLPAYIEASSERSAALYERHGFRLTSELRVGSCPPLRLMFRPPAA